MTPTHESKLIVLIRQIKASGRPMVSICYGHQAIAKALGGTVGENPDGWVAGAAEYRTPEGAHDRTLLALHKEQILTLPGEAEIVSGSSACPYAVLRYGDAALTYQAHPEFTADFVRGLVRTRGKNLTHDIRPMLVRRMMPRSRAPALAPKSPIFSRRTDCKALSGRTIQSVSQS